MESVLQGGQLGNSTVVLGLNDVLESKVQKSTSTVPILTPASLLKMAN